MNDHSVHGSTIVVGGGVIGVCCAYFLARRGAPALVLERDAVGRAASYGNAGTISPGHGPINKPGRVTQALRWMLNPRSPLYIPPRWDPALMRWLWMFRARCTPAHLDAAMRALAPLGHATRALFDELVETEALECGFRPEGYYEVFRTRTAFDAAQAENALVRRGGFGSTVVSGGELREREPALRPGVVGGVFHPDAATCDPYRFVTELADRTRRLGGEIREHTEIAEVLTKGSRVIGVRTTAGEAIEARNVVLATGAYGLHLTRRMGCRLPIQAGKGYHRDRDPRAGGTPALGVTCMLGEQSVFCTPMDGVVRFAGTMEFSGLNHVLRRDRLEQLTSAAARYLHGVGESDARSEWCGLRPCAPDGLPVIGPVPGIAGAFVATGHAMLGLTLGPVTGRLMAELVLDASASLDMTALRPDRF